MHRLNTRLRHAFAPYTFPLYTLPPPAIRPANSSLDTSGSAGKLRIRPMPPRSPATPESLRRLIVATLPETARAGANPVIFGPGGALDSLGLVNFLADLEYRLAEAHGRELVLASERAMSRSRSPFRDVDALTAYVAELLAE